jgi:hypothetical protein
VSAYIPRRTCIQNALNLNREPINNSGLNTSGAVAFTAAVAVAAITMDAILRVGLAVLSLPLPDILIYQVSPLTL